MIDVDWRPDNRKLRTFATGALVAFGLLGVWIAWKTGGFAGTAALVWPVRLWAFGLLSGIVGWVYPKGILPLYWVLTAVSLPIGIVVSFLVVAIVFYLIVTPIGLVFRMAGRDILGRRPDRKVESYWLERPEQAPPERYYRQF
jgi:hypothetical protein